MVGKGEAPISARKGEASSASLMDDSFEDIIQAIDFEKLCQTRNYELSPLEIKRATKNKKNRVKRLDKIKHVGKNLNQESKGTDQDVMTEQDKEIQVSMPGRDKMNTGKDK